MHVRTQCTKCQTTIRADKNRLGSSLLCPSCGDEFLFDTFEPAIVEPIASGHLASRPPRAKRSTKRRPIERRPSAARSANPLLAIVFGALMTVGFFAVLLGPARGTPVSVLFTERGWVQYAIASVGFWSLAMVLLKALKLVPEMRILTLDLLPVDISEELRPGNAELFREHIYSLSAKPRKSFLLSQALLALDCLKARGNAQEITTALRAQEDLESAAMDSSYSLLRVLLWAMPTLGFVGTVLGIGDAVHELSAAVGTATAFSDVVKALNGVTGGLAVAFDTTLAALVASLIVMFPKNWLLKSEEDLMIASSTRLSSELLGRVKESVEVLGDEVMDGPNAGTASGAIADPGAIVEAWSAEIQRVGAATTEQSVQAWRVALQDLEGLQVRQTQSLEAVSTSLRESLREIQQDSARAAKSQLETLSDLSRQATEECRSRFNSVEQALQTVKGTAVVATQTFAKLRERAGEEANEATIAMREAAQAIRAIAPDKLMANNVALKRLFDGYVQLLRYQKAIAAKHEAFAGSSALPTAVEGFAKQVTKLAQVIVRIERREEAALKREPAMLAAKSLWTWPLFHRRNGSLSRNGGES